MDYSIFDTNAILLGLLSAMLGAECVILFVKSQSLRHKVSAEFDAVLNSEKQNYKNRERELELGIKERSLVLEHEYEALISEAKKRKDILDEKLARVSFDAESRRLSAERAKGLCEKYERLSKEAEALSKEYLSKLGECGNLNLERLKSEAMRELGRACRAEAESLAADFLKSRASEAEAEARRILLDILGRCAVKVNSESASCVVKLPNEAMKGRMIGKEGRNIRSFEACTGTTLVIDETPDSVMISSFDPSRREIAKIALENLMLDGRINPGTIEDAVRSARSEIEKKCIDYGRAAAEALGFKNFTSDVLSRLGALRFHLSLNQNTLEHSMETARIAALIASEIGCDTYIAKRAGMLHDIGKAIEGDSSHSAAGADFLSACGENEIIVSAVRHHHDEAAAGVYGAIVKVADSISASRAGARMEPAESYFTRVKNLESIAKGFDGVISAYALQAGRELRVVIEPDEVDDASAEILARRIKERVCSQIDTSVPVKIILIREKRFVEKTGA